MISPGIILSPIGMMFTRPDFSPAKYCLNPIGDMTDTLCWAGLFSAPALNPTVNNHTLYGVVLSNRGVGMRKPPAKNKQKDRGLHTIHTL